MPAINATVEWKIKQIGFDANGDGQVMLDRVMTTETGEIVLVTSRLEILQKADVDLLLDAPLPAGVTIRQAIKSAVFSKLAL